MYRRLDNWVWGLSRVEYALLTGTTAALGALAVGTVFGAPDYAFAFGLGLTMTVVYYLFNPNQRDE